MTNWMLHILNNTELDELHSWLYRSLSGKNGLKATWMNELFEEVIKEQHKRMD